ncbi:MAG: ABC transporter ATP-binding protein [Cystobacterineae bacterium]|nr:ABC transporter ATP-binding protein [Cystobacterineae bacterium]
MREKANALEVIHLQKSFGNLKVIDNLSFEVKKGEILGLLGPNGAGKTTLIHLIINALKKDSGDIRIDGCSVQENAHLLEKVGVCTQELQLWPLLSCEEQLHFMSKIHGIDRKEAKKRAGELLEKIGLKEKRKTLAKKLSGGMKRRLHLVMSLIHFPELIILDEPEAGLDPQSRVLVREFIKSLAPSQTILLTTHNMDEAERLADRVAIMDKGKLLELDTADALRKKRAPDDALDIVYDKKITLPLELNTTQLNTTQYRVHAKNETLTVVGENLVRLLPEILDKAIAQLGHPVSFNFRQSSLEDVFINLTGRSLRE